MVKFLRACWALKRTHAVSICMICFLTVIHLNNWSNSAKIKKLQNANILAVYCTDQFEGHWSENVYRLFIMIDFKQKYWISHLLRFTHNLFVINICYHCPFYRTYLTSNSQRVTTQQIPGSWLKFSLLWVNYPWLTTTSACKEFKVFPGMLQAIIKIQREQNEMRLWKYIVYLRLVKCAVYEG